MAAKRKTGSKNASNRVIDVKGSFTVDEKGNVVKTSKEIAKVVKGRDGSYTISIRLESKTRAKRGSKKKAVEAAE